MLTFYTVKLRAEKHKGITDCPAGSEHLSLRMEMNNSTEFSSSHWKVLKPRRKTSEGKM